MALRTVGASRRVVDWQTTMLHVLTRCLLTQNEKVGRDLQLCYILYTSARTYRDLAAPAKSQILTTTRL